MYNIILKHFLASRLYEKCVMIGYGMGRDIKLWIDLAVSRGLYGWLRVCCLGSIESAHGTDSNEVWSLSFLMGIQIVRCTMNFRVGASSVPVSTDALMPDDFFFIFRKQHSVWNCEIMNTVPQNIAHFILNSIGERGASWPGGRLPLFLLKIQF